MFWKVWKVIVYKKKTITDVNYRDWIVRSGVVSITIHITQDFKHWKCDWYHYLCVFIRVWNKNAKNQCLDYK